MTSDIIEKAFHSAADDFNESLALMQPYRNDSEGYCEANLVEYYSCALREHNFRPFLELPILPKGRVDALFLRGSTALLLEAKQFYRGNVPVIQGDVDRLQLLDLSALLQQYKFRNGITERFHIVLCDCWKQVERQEWDRFLSGYSKLAHPIHNGYPNQKFEYAWLLAYKEIFMNDFSNARSDLSLKVLKKLKEDVRAGDAKAIKFAKSFFGEINTVLKLHGEPLFVRDADGNLTIEDTNSVT